MFTNVNLLSIDSVYQFISLATMCSTNTDRPHTPNEEDCCGNACNPCIFDVHKNLLKQWTLNNSINAVKKKNLLVPTGYKSFEVTKVDHVNDEYIIVCLRYAEPHDNGYQIFINPGQHVIINMSSMSKPFTPFSWADDSLQLLIRIYPTGKFLKELKTMKRDKLLKVRGPYGDFQYARNNFMKIIMFGIGSGIAALYPIVKSIVDDEFDVTRVDLIVGFHCMDQVPLKKELQLLTDYWNVSCTLCLSQQELVADETNLIHGFTIRRDRIDGNIAETIFTKELPESTLVMVCGTDKFNEFLENQIKRYNFNNYYVFK